MRNGKAQPASARPKASPPSAGEGIIVIDASMNLIASDRGAEAILNDLHKHNGLHTDGMPTQLIKLLTARPENDLDAAYTHVAAGDREYSCRVFVMHSKDDDNAPPLLTVHLRREVSVEDAVHQVGVDYHLTDREQEALIGVSMGLTSKELATRMNISPNTVKAFLRLIMIKMGASTRAGIVGKLLEQNAHSSAGH